MWPGPPLKTFPGLNFHPASHISQFPLPSFPVNKEHFLFASILHVSQPAPANFCCLTHFLFMKRAQDGALSCALTHISCKMAQLKQESHLWSCLTSASQQQLMSIRPGYPRGNVPIWGDTRGFPHRTTSCQIAPALPFVHDVRILCSSGQWVLIDGQAWQCFPTTKNSFLVVC